MTSEKWVAGENSIFWFLPGTDLLHRIDGPAIEYSHGVNYWYYNGIQIDCQSQEEFNRKIKLLAFL